MIGRRLKLARAASGLSLRQLEAKVCNRVSAQTISKYERDLSLPSSGVLIALASALEVSADFLAGNQELILDGIEFRKKGAVGKRERARVEAMALHLLERYLVVEEALNLPSVEWDRPGAAPWPVRNGLEEAEHAAARLRRHWNLGMDPIPNLVELLEERGIKVLAVHLRDIDGLTAEARLGRREAMPIIIVNLNDSGERQRFTLAHELGHLVMDVADGIDAEKASQRFAGAFLMPADALMNEIGKRRASISIMELIYVKKLFGVSIQAIAHRCRDLGIIGNRFFRSLFREFHRLGWRNPPYEEPASRSKEIPTRFKRLTLRALSERVLTDSKAAELLGIRVRELDDLMDAVLGSEVEA